MPLTENPAHIFEPNPLACGQAVLAMLTDRPVGEIIELLGTDRETTLAQMVSALEENGIRLDRNKKEARTKEELPRVCVLSLETPKCWHWSLCFEGKFYDPEYGILDDFPPTKRKYYFEIK